jgi:hypothetical protein
MVAYFGHCPANGGGGVSNGDPVECALCCVVMHFHFIPSVAIARILQLILRCRIFRYPAGLGFRQSVQLCRIANLAATMFALAAALQRLI